MRGNVERFVNAIELLVYNKRENYSKDKRAIDSSASTEAIHSMQTSK